MYSDLTCTGIFAGYGRSQVLSGITAAFPAGCVTGILGSNGAGKTTLLRVLSGYLPISRGEITLSGKDLLSITPRDRAKAVSVVPQIGYSALPLTVFEAVALGRYPFVGWSGKLDKSNRKKSLEALGLLELEPLADRRCDMLSGGEWRKVLIAQGVAQQAQALLLDEPTAFLDPPAKHSLLRTLRRIARERQTAVVVVLHDPELGQRYADHVVLLKDGALLAAGPAGETLNEHNLCELYNCDSPWWVPEEVTC